MSYSQYQNFSYWRTVMHLNTAFQLFNLNFVSGKKHWRLLYVLRNERAISKHYKTGSFNSVMYSTLSLLVSNHIGILKQLGGEESACQRRRHRFDPWVWKIPWGGKRQPTPVFLLGKSHGQRSLASYTPCGRKQPDMMSDSAHTHKYLYVLFINLNQKS